MLERRIDIRTFNGINDNGEAMSCSSMAEKLSFLSKIGLPGYIHHRLFGGAAMPGSDCMGLAFTRIGAILTMTAHGGRALGQTATAIFAPASFY